MKNVFLILSLVLSGCATRIPASAPETLDAKNSLDAAKACAVQASTKYSRSGESIQDVIDAALVACVSEIDTFKANTAKQFHGHPDNEIFVKSRVDLRLNDLRAHLKIHIIEVRSKN